MDTKTENSAKSSNQPAAMNKNKSLDRESLGCQSVLLYSGIFLLVDVWKQVTTYGMKYYNDNHYPLPQTALVCMGEIFKCSVFFVVLIYNGMLTKVSVSKWYAVPAILYAINNNIYLAGLRYCTPPVWNILIQLRILNTAFTYRVFFKRTITSTQWIALFVLISAIVLTNFTGGNEMGGHQNLPMAMLLAACGSVGSVIGAVSMEYLFKNDHRSFSDMQFQLYSFTAVAAGLLWGMESQTTTPEEYTPGNPYLVASMVILCTVLSCLSGVAVGFIVKKLDNIVKLYSQAISNMITSIACTLLFPDHFTLNFLFVCCLVLMFLAVFMYENKNIKMSEVKVKVMSLLGEKSGKSPLPM